MKKIYFGTSLIMLCIAFVSMTACSLIPVHIEMEESEIFTYEEIVQAMDIVKEAFVERFSWNDRLVRLSYTGNFSSNNRIVIMSTYYQPRYGYLGHGWGLSRECSSESWVLVSGPIRGNMGH